MTRRCQQIFAKAVVGFGFASEQSVRGHSCYVAYMSQVGCGMLVRFAFGVCRCVDHYGFSSFILACVCQLALA